MRSVMIATSADRAWSRKRIATSPTIIDSSTSFIVFSNSARSSWPSRTSLPFEGLGKGRRIRVSEDDLEALRREPPDLVVLDWMLPELSGIDVLKEMRAAKPAVNYLVGTPKGRLTKLGKDLADKDWQAVKDDVHVKLLPCDGELYVLARSLPRRSMGAMTSTQFRLLKRLNK